MLEKISALLHESKFNVNFLLQSVTVINTKSVGNFFLKRIIGTYICAAKSVRLFGRMFKLTISINNCTTVRSTAGLSGRMPGVTLVTRQSSNSIKLIESDTWILFMLTDLIGEYPKMPEQK